MLGMDRAVPVQVRVDRDHLPRALVAVITGELDFGTTPRLVDALRDEPPLGASVVLDMAGVDFCDSSALGAMISLYKAAAKAGGQLYLTGVGPQVASAIAVTSLDQLFLVRADVAQVLAEIGP
jgi:anti-sigma B factor antagonist